MIITPPKTISTHDKEILCRLAGQKVKIVQHPLNMERKDRWHKFDAGICECPMVLAEAGGVRDRVKPLPESILECEDSWTRGIERGLRFEIYQFEVLKDVHTLNNEPQRLSRWVEIVKEEIDNAA